jgi:hypothetical protein
MPHLSTEFGVNSERVLRLRISQNSRRRCSNCRITLASGWWRRVFPSNKNQHVAIFVVRVNNNNNNNNVTLMPIARHRLAKYIPADTNARKNRKSITRQGQQYAGNNRITSNRGRGVFYVVRTYPSRGNGCVFYGSTWRSMVENQLKSESRVEAGRIPPP